MGVVEKHSCFSGLSVANQMFVSCANIGFMAKDKTLF